MIIASDNVIFVYEPQREAYVRLESDGLRRELCEAFEQCSVGASWMVDCILQALPEKLTSSREADIRLTEEDVRDLLANALFASGFPEVARTFVDNYVLAVQTRETSESSESQGEVPPHHHTWDPQSLTSHVHYISGDQWNLNLDDNDRNLITQRILIPQPVSDIIPMAVVQCRLPRIWDIQQPTPSTEAEFISLLPGIAMATQNMLTQMRRRINSEWNGIQQANSAVRFTDFSALAQLLGIKKSRPLRQEAQKRIKDAITELFASKDGSDKIDLHFE